IRVAAASLLPDTKKSSQLAIPVLVAAREKATPETQWRIDQALVGAYQITEQWEPMLAAADRLVEKFPDSDIAFRAAGIAMSKLKREEELRKRALARLERLPDNIIAQQLLGTLSLSAGQYDEAVKYFGGVLERANPTAGDYNEHAWASLFAKKDLDRALENAQLAATESPEAHSIQNTLAVLFAEQGRTSEAREALLKCAELSESGELNTVDWYIVGRLAENYGIHDAAAEAYQKVTKPERVKGSTWELAQARLAGLGKR
ncbi:MAG: hypothetical protein ACLGH0_04105, partial [Thermoanaerobaculia bacterium]